MSIKIYKSGFTLAETMIVLVILGVVAAITVPALVRNHIASQNRTRIRKAMTVYDMLINKIVVENSLKDDIAVQNWANANGTCINSSNYFKVAENVIENGNPNTCKFRANDGVWWDITNILNPTIGLREADLDANVNSDTRFKLLSHFDQNGSLRVDDLAYEMSNPDITEAQLDAIKKLYGFINNSKKNENQSSEEEFYKLSYDGIKCQKLDYGDYCEGYATAKTPFGVQVSFYCNGSTLEDAKNNCEQWKPITFTNPDNKKETIEYDCTPSDGTAICGFIARDSIVEGLKSGTIKKRCNSENDNSDCHIEATGADVSIEYKGEVINFSWGCDGYACAGTSLAINKDYYCVYDFDTDEFNCVESNFH